MRIAILGAGAMGSWFGGQLALHGHDVQLLTTNQAHRDAVQQHGLTMRYDESEETVAVAIAVPADITGPVDLIILLTKSFQSEPALAAVAPKFNEATHVLTLQNGLGNAEVVAQYLPLQRVLVGNTMLPVEKIAAGVVVAKGEGKTYFNTAGGHDSPMTQRISDAFAPTRIDIQVDPNIQQRIWSKVAFNAGMNTLCALAHATPGTIGALPAAKLLAQDVAAAASVGVTTPA